MFPTLPGGQADTTRGLYEDRINVFVRIGGAASWDGKKLRGAEKGVLVQRGYLIATLLQRRGFVAKELNTSASDTLHQLANGGFDVAILQGVGGERLLQSDASLAGKIMQAPVPYEVMSMYLFIGRKTYEKDPKRIEAIWNTIRSVRNTAEYSGLESRSKR